VCFLTPAGAVLPAISLIAAHNTTGFVNNPVPGNKSVPAKVLAKNTKTFAGTDLLD